MGRLFGVGRLGVELPGLWVGGLVLVGVCRAGGGGFGGRLSFMRGDGFREMIVDFTAVADVLFTELIWGFPYPELKI